MNERFEAKNSTDLALKNRVSFGNSIHVDFLNQIESLLLNAELSATDRQTILANLNCPCCGGNGAAFTIKLGEQD